jgi:hypothetical protein
MDFITGEKIQFLCNHFIGNEKDFKYNPNVNKFHKNKCMNMNTMNSEIENKMLVFCYTHLLDNLDFLISKLTYFKNPFILVFHNSDGCFKKEHLLLFDKLHLLEFIYTQNMDVIHSKVLPLPIGLGNSMWKHGKLDNINIIYNLTLPKTEDIFFNFQKGTNTRIRNECYDSILKLGIPWIRKKPHMEYLKTLKQYKFCICPEGNGIDTHRFWECLYMNVIPICKKNILVEHYSNYFHIIIVNDWSDINIDELIYTYDKNIYTINHNLLDLHNLPPFQHS